MSLLKKVSYPNVRRSASTFLMHGTVVPDPYEWLEQPDSDETKAFVTEQNKSFQQAIAGFEKKDELKKKLTDLRNYPRVGCPNRGKDSQEYYFYYNPGLLNQSRLMRLRKGLASNSTQNIEQDSEVFFDPNTLSEDGTSAIGASGWSVSRRYFAHGICDKGSDWNTVHIKDSETNQMLPDVLKWVKYSGIAWYQDPVSKKDVGFFYTRFPALDESTDKGTETAKAENGCVYFHRLGDAQEKDALVVRDPTNPEWLVGAGVTDDMKFIYASFSNGCEKENLFWLAPVPEGFADKNIDEAEWKWAKLCQNWNAEWGYMANDGNKFWFRTTLNAPGYCVVTFDFDFENPESDKNVLKTENVKVAVPEKEFVLEMADVVGQNILLLYLEQVKHVLYIAKLETPAETKKIDLPIGSVTGLACRRESPFVALKLTSFVLPGRSYFFELNLDGSSPLPPPLTVWKDEGPQQGFNGDDFVVEQYFYPSAAGERKVPMFVCRHKTVEYDRNRPTILYGYGGFNISLTPSFSIGNFVWMSDFKGVYAVANIRGGGELPKWHEEGKALTKMNCYEDFCAAARFLQKDLNVTKPSMLAINGGSNGGTLVTASMIREPHLFGAVVCQVGVLDLFKFHKFGIGHAWRSDFNDPEKEEDFRYIQKFSPLHTLRANVLYPPVLIATGDHDDRVSPLHSHKFTAALQTLSPDFGGPFLERVEVNAGHGAGKSLTKVIEEQCDTYAFIALSLGIQME